MRLHPSGASRQPVTCAGSLAMLHISHHHLRHLVLQRNLPCCPCLHTQPHDSPDHRTASVAPNHSGQRLPARHVPPHWHNGLICISNTEQQPDRSAQPIVHRPVQLAMPSIEAHNQWQLPPTLVHHRPSWPPVHTLEIPQDLLPLCLIHVSAHSKPKQVHTTIHSLADVVLIQRLVTK